MVSAAPIGLDADYFEQSDCGRARQTKELGMPPAGWGQAVVSGAPAWEPVAARAAALAWAGAAAVAAMAGAAAGGPDHPEESRLAGLNNFP
jgi:hypothetical protein